MLNPRSLQLIAQKALLNLWLDLHWVFAGPVGFQQRVDYSFQKYRAILKNSNQIQFLRHQFYYDNRLTPALLPDYVFEIHELEQSLDFSRIQNVLDIGGNIGQFSFSLKARHPHLKIYSFEPNPVIFPLLLKNAAAFNDWACFNFGVGETDQRLPLYFVPGKSSQGSLFRDNASQGLTSTLVENVSIQIRSLSESTLKELNLPGGFDLIKIDVEGAELLVLKSLKNIKWKFLYIELCEGRSGGTSLEQAIVTLQQSVNNNVTIVKTSPPRGQGQTFQALFKANFV